MFWLVFDHIRVVLVSEPVSKVMMFVADSGLDSLISSIVLFH